jgi:hypothetical protein
MRLKVASPSPGCVVSGESPPAGAARADAKKPQSTVASATLATLENKTFAVRHIPDTDPPRMEENACF